jgi:gliding motility-associated-like protein
LGKYTLILSDDQGCTYSAGTLIEVRDPHIEQPIQRIYFPTAFSPNGDGINDTWQIMGLEEQHLLHIEIYDRWGGLVYACQGSSSLCAWDGHFRGRLVDPGVYTWQVAVINTEGQSSHFQGEVTVLR